MGQQNIYRTTSVSSVMPQSMMQDTIDYLISNRNFILSSEKKSEAFKTRFFGHSLLSEIVHRLTILGKDEMYSLIRFPSKTVALREAVDMTFLPIDLLQMKEVTSFFSKSLSVIPELDDKLVINVTDITKANGDFSDITQFHYRVVRDFLSRSFYVSTANVWLSPTLVRYVAKVYSMTIGGQIARLFGLTPLVQTFIQTVFCVFFVGKMTSPDVTTSFMKTHASYMNLRNPSELTQVMAFIQDILNKSAPDSLEDVCEVIDAYGHDQLKSDEGSRVTRPVLNARFKSLFPEGHVSIIALEYPPYFLFLILLVLSNIRIGLSFPMKNLNLEKEGRDILEQVVKSHSFI